MSRCLQLSTIGLSFTGLFFCMSVVIGIMLLASQIGVYTVAYKVVYALTSLAGIILTVSATVAD